MINILKDFNFRHVSTYYVLSLFTSYSTGVFAFAVIALFVLVGRLLKNYDYYY